MEKQRTSNPKISYTILCMIFSIMFILTALNFPTPAYARQAEGIDGCKSVPLDANFSYEKSKFGNQSPSRFKIISGVPTTFSSSGDGNGAVLKNKLLEDTGNRDENGNKILRAVRIVESYFGSDMANKFINSNKDQYLIFEGVYWFTMNEGSPRYGEVFHLGDYLPGGTLFTGANMEEMGIADNRVLIRKSNNGEIEGGTVTQDEDGKIHITVE